MSFIFNKSGTKYQQPNRGDDLETAFYLSPSDYLSENAFYDRGKKVKKAYAIKALKTACKEQGKRFKQELLQEAFRQAHLQQKDNKEARYHHFGKNGRLLAVYDLSYLFKFFKLKGGAKLK